MTNKVCGIRDVASLIGVSLDSAKRLRKSGALDAAVVEPCGGWHRPMIIRMADGLRKMILTNEFIQAGANDR